MVYVGNFLIKMFNLIYRVLRIRKLIKMGLRNFLRYLCRVIIRLNVLIFILNNCEFKSNSILIRSGSFI